MHDGVSEGAQYSAPISKSDCKNVQNVYHKQCTAKCHMSII